MAEPLSAARLLSALRGEGVEVVEVGKWRSHNRNSKGPWGPVNGVMVHHTVTSGTDASVRICRDGYSSLPGPLCHGVIDKQGTVHMVGHGRANHAGSGDDDVFRAVVAERSPLPPDNEANTDGNRHFYGFECINLGDNRDPWPAEQVEATARAAAAICRAHGWSERSVIGHSEWQPGKVDPRGPIGRRGGPALTMDRLRARVAELLAADPDDTAPPAAEEPQGEERTAIRYRVRDGDTLWAIAERHGSTVEAIADASQLDDPNRLVIGRWLTIPAGRAPSRPTVDLSRLRTAALADPPKRGTPVSYDGTRTVEDALVRAGLLDRDYADGHFGTATVHAYARWQRRCGYSGAAADGIPGRASLAALGRRYGFDTTA